METKNQKIGFSAATSIVIANMIGAGIFTSLGFQLEWIQNTWSIIILWVIGGIMALCGAFSYAELGTALRRSGGEYHFISETFSPILGYLSGWTSMTVGFAAPVALSAIACSSYTQNIHNVDVVLISIILVILISSIHLIDLDKSARFQLLTTGLKIILILIFIMVGITHNQSANATLLDNSWTEELMSPGFAIALIYVSFSYSGWNASAYIVEEIDNPKKTLPASLITGTLLVVLLYILLNIVFLQNASLSELTGKIEIGQITSKNIFGEVGGRIMSSAIALMLISGISAMIWTGPRVIQRMAEDYNLWTFLAKARQEKIPVKAILFQGLISIALILTGTFEQILIYCGFLLNFFSALSVAGVFIIRKKQLNSYKSPIFPIPQIIYLLLSAWIMIYLIYQQPIESLYGMANIVIGIGSYYLSLKISSKNE